MSKEKEYSGGTAAEEPPTPQKAYLVLNELKGIIDGKLAYYARGQTIPSQIAERIPALPALLSSGSLKEVYV